MSFTGKAAAAALNALDANAASLMAKLDVLARIDTICESPKVLKHARAETPIGYILD